MIRVLIVDDQPAFRTQLRRLLHRAGFDVVGEAGTIPEAETQVRSLRPDLAVVDVMLPGVNGLAGAPRLKALLPGLRVILISAYADRADALRLAAREAGAETFVAKDDLDLRLVETWKTERSRTMYLVVGATGDLGGAITHMLLAQHQAVRILARPQSPYQPLVAAGAQVAPGDLKTRTSLDPACQGVDIVITTANSAQRGGPDTPQTVDLAGNRNLIDAARAAGVKQFIFVSVSTADPNSPIPFVAAKGQTEAYLRDSGMSYTILAPDPFMEFWIGFYIGMPILQGRPVTIVGEGKRRHSFISAADVAAFALAAGGHPKAINQRLVLGGPEPCSFRDAVAAYERVLGHPVTVQSVRPGEPVPGLPEAVWGLAVGFEMFDSPINMTETARTFGVRLTSLEEFVRRSVAHA